MSWLLSITHWHWLALGTLLLITEVMISGGFLLWIGLSAIFVSIMVWLLPSMAIHTQLLLFAIGAMMTSFGWWAYLRYRPIETEDPKLNRRLERYIGQTFILIEPIVNGRGKIHAGDTVWVVKGPDLPVGASVKIIGVEGMTLRISQNK